MHQVAIWMGVEFSDVMGHVGAIECPYPERGAGRGSGSDEVLDQMGAYAVQIARARHGLAHVAATIDLFAAPERHRARCIVSHGFFKTGEIADICIRHLGVEAELTTRELAERVMAERDLAERDLAERDLDISDTVLRTSVVFKVFKGIQAPRHATPNGDSSSE